MPKWYSTLAFGRFVVVMTIVFSLDDNSLMNDWFGRFTKTYALKCFTCDGRCFSDTHCNCQTGMCEGDYCFAERTMKENEYYLRKGCARGKIKVGSECEQQRTKKTILCYCKHADFCNNEILSTTDSRTLKNVTCNKCKSTTNTNGCSKWCQGDYCWVNSAGGTTGASMDCGYSSLSLQYHYTNPNLLYAGSRNIFDQGSACLNYKAGLTYQMQECICNGNYCNYRTLPDNNLIVLPPATKKQDLIMCYSCVETSSEQAVPPSSCKMNTCLGQFCVLTIESQTADRNDMLFQRTAGCLNSSRPALVQRGCVQRWTLKKWEKIECLCQKDFCNSDVTTANAPDNKTLSIKSTTFKITTLFWMFTYLRNRID